MNRRQMIRSCGVGLTLAALPVAASVKDTESPRLIVVLLRGGLDGLAAVPPFGDRHYQSARGQLAQPEPGHIGGTLDLDGYFGLHPNLAKLKSRYAAGEVLVVHAVSPPYSGRSHFAGQDVLETGLPAPSGSTTGWLYRALQVQERPYGQAAYAIGGNMPRILLGPEAAGSWSPDRLPTADEETVRWVRSLYDNDAILGPKLSQALAADAVTGSLGDSTGLRNLATATARLLAEDSGPTVAVLETSGWDTHAAQGVADGRLASRLGALDEMLDTLRDGLGSHWENTVIVVATEFGRTVAMNGTRGTDHGVGSVALLLGGRVAGGRVLADWPGISKDRLFEGRDLRATTDLRSVFAGVLESHLQVPQSAISEEIFPGLSAWPGDLMRV